MGGWRGIAVLTTLLAVAALALAAFGVVPGVHLQRLPKATPHAPANTLLDVSVGAFYVYEGADKDPPPEAYWQSVPGVTIVFSSEAGERETVVTQGKAYHRTDIVLRAGVRYDVVATLGEHSASTEIVPSGYRYSSTSGGDGGEFTVTARKSSGLIERMGYQPPALL